MVTVKVPEEWREGAYSRPTPRQRAAMRQVIDAAAGQCADRSESLASRKSLFAACVSVTALLEGREEPDVALCERRACEFVT